MKQTTLQRGDFTAASVRFVEVNELAEEELGAVDVGLLFVYLYRRFGAPLQTAHADKAVAEYQLTTVDDDVMLRVSIGACNVFGVTVRYDKFSAWRHPVYLSFLPEHASHIEAVLRSALRELREPVRIRDTELTPLAWE